MNQLLNRRFGVFYRIVDVLLILFSLHLSYLLRTTIELGKPTIPEAVQIPPILFPIAVIVWQVAFAVFRVYRVTHRNLRALTVRRLIQGHMVATLAFRVFCISAIVIFHVYKPFILSGCCLWAW